MAFAQDAMKVLDITADRIRKAGNVKIEYKASIFAGATEKASSTGTMWLQESKMKLETGDINTWYNGKTRWCYVPSANEVNIDEPSKKEMAAMNPYTFMNIYKKGFKMTVKETVLRGEAVYEVYLRARYQLFQQQSMQDALTSIPFCSKDFNQADNSPSPPKSRTSPDGPMEWMPTN